MFEISAETYAAAKVHTIAVGNRRLFWATIRDLQDRLDIKTISDLVRKESDGTFETKFLQKIKSGNIKDLEENDLVLMFVLMFVV